jgi:outer membrane protein assembly factor BamB
LWVVAAVLAVVGVGGWVTVDRSGADEPEASDGWTSDELSNSRMLTTDGERVCSTTLERVLYCLDAATGEELFTTEIDSDSLTSPQLVGDSLVLGGSRFYSGELYTYSLEGDEQWRAPIDADDEDTRLPIAGDVTAVVEDEQLVGVDLATGEELWRTYAESDDEGGSSAGDSSGDGLTAVPSDVFTDGSRFYAAVQSYDPATGGGDGHVVAVDPGSGSEIWRSPQLPDVGMRSGIRKLAPFDDGSAVAVHLEGFPQRIVVLESETGQMRWEVGLVSEYASVAHLDGLTVVADGADTRAYDAQGQEVWAMASPVLESKPDLLSPGELVVDQGRLFAVGYDVYEIDPADQSSRLLRSGGSAHDVVVVGDLLVISAVMELQAVPLDPPDE